MRGLLWSSLIHDHLTIRQNCSERLAINLSFSNSWWRCFCCGIRRRHVSWWNYVPGQMTDSFVSSWEPVDEKVLIQKHTIRLLSFYLSLSRSQCLPVWSFTYGNSWGAPVLLSLALRRDHIARAESVAPLQQTAEGHSWNCLSVHFASDTVHLLILKSSAGQQSNFVVIKLLLSHSLRSSEWEGALWMV